MPIFPCPKMNYIPRTVSFSKKRRKSQSASFSTNFKFFANRRSRRSCSLNTNTLNTLMNWSNGLHKENKEDEESEENEGEDDDEIVGYVKYKDMTNASHLIPYITYGMAKTFELDISDYRTDFLEKKLYSLHLKGVEFHFQSYAPRTFFDIRKMYGIRQKDFEKSVIKKHLTGGGLGPGKSGMLFFYSQDNKYIVKTCTRKEIKFLRKILRSYHEYIKNNKHTLITRFYGIFKIKMPNAKPLRIIIMNNLFNTKKTIQHKFDLKGSIRNRFVDCEKEEKRSQGVLKDLNFQDMVYLGPSKNAFLTQFKMDAEWLTSMKVMDHSLLIGISKENRLDIPRDSVPIDISKIKEPLIKTKNKKFVTCFEEKNGGLQAFNSDGTPRLEIYFMGIIDILQEFDVKKKMESTYKGILYKKKEISAVSAKFYGERFINFIESKMV